MKRSRIGILAVVVLALAVSVGVVSAQPGNPGGGGPGGNQGGRDGGRDGGRGANGDRGGMLQDRPLMGAARELLQIVADATGLDLFTINEQVRAGSSLAEVITANGGDVAAVKAEAITVATDAINQAVEDGRITQERADELLANLETAIDAALNRNPAEEQFKRQVVARVAGETGLQARDIMQQWQHGATLTQILTDSGEDVAAFTTETLDLAAARLTEAVENGRITQETADAWLVDYQTYLPELLNAAFETVFPLAGERMLDEEPAGQL